jgi:hypothetical protein
LKLLSTVVLALAISGCAQAPTQKVYSQEELKEIALGEMASRDCVVKGMLAPTQPLAKYNGFMRNRLANNTSSTEAVDAARKHAHSIPITKGLCVDVLFAAQSFVL